MVHVGALKALETQGVEFRGMAGTSAGAIVATLKAAGFNADEIVDPVERKTLLSSIGTGFGHKLETAVDFFEPPGWRRIRLFRAALNCLSGFRLLVMMVAAAVLALGSLYLATLYYGAAGAVAVFLLWGAVAYFIYGALMRGLTTVTRFRDVLDRTLQQRVFTGTTPRQVLFRDFGRDGRPTLKVVATDLTKGELKLFSPDTTPEVCVADAVAASVCLPVIFAPWKLGDCLHFDGGLVSNLPAWTFDEECALDPEAMTIAIGIRATSERADPPTSRRWLGQAIKTAVFGASLLNTRAVENLEGVILSTDLNLLAFDAGAETVFKTVKDATDAAQVRVVQRLITIPQVYRGACKAACEVAANVLKERPDVLGNKAFEGRIRAALAMPREGTHHSLRLRYGVGYDGNDDTDEDLLLPVEHSYAGEAFRDGEPSFAQFKAVDGAAAGALGEHLPGDANRRRRRLLRRDLAWLLCIPIRVGGRIPFVVALDCNQPIDPASESFPEVVNLLSGEIATIFGKAQEKIEGREP